MPAFEEGLYAQKEIVNENHSRGTETEMALRSIGA